jgi:curved DNA-binding protein CbpA
MDYYEILGVSKNAEQEVIKNAYRALSRKYHPDTNPDSEEKYKQITEAYRILGNRAERWEYDREQKKAEARNNVQQQQAAYEQELAQTQQKVEDLQRQREEQVIWEHERKKKFVVKPKNLGEYLNTAGLDYKTQKKFIGLSFLSGGGFFRLFFYVSIVATFLFPVLALLIANYAPGQTKVAPIVQFQILGMMIQFTWPLLTIDIILIAIPRTRKIIFGKKRYMINELMGSIHNMTYDEQVAEMKELRKFKSQNNAIIRKHKFSKLQNKFKKN